MGALSAANCGSAPAVSAASQRRRLTRRSNHAATHYRYSLMLMQPGRSAEEAARHARRAVELDPAQPLYWLARAHSEMQLDRWEAARASLEQVRSRAADPELADVLGEVGAQTLDVDVVPRLTEDQQQIGEELGILAPEREQEEEQEAAGLLVEDSDHAQVE